jgi:hypothetical protein
LFGYRSGAESCAHQCACVQNDPSRSVHLASCTMRFTS